MSIYFENLGQKKELIESPSCVFFACYVLITRLHLTLTDNTYT
nr:MAG TPA: hypothetical protein [Caudoviricetes sp.]